MARLSFLFRNLLSAGAVCALVISTSAQDKPLKAFWTDVEGGAATLIVTPAGESILIDTGNPGVRDSSRIHKTATQIAGIDQIDYLITTHFHIDHFGGAAELAALMPIKTVYDNGIPETNPDNNPNDTRFPLMIKPYREMTVGERRVIQPGDELPLKQTGDTKVSMTCLAAQQKFISTSAGGENSPCADGSEKAKDMSDNANSVVMLLKFGDFEMFIGGDLTWNIEAGLVCPNNRVGVVDVYQVTHHGLDTSNNPVLVKSLEPTVTIMSNGTRKGCGAESFGTLKSVDSIEAMYQIHRNLRQDRENNTVEEHIANLEADCDGNHIELAVAPNAKTYTVSIPANGHSKTFETK